MIFVIRSFSVFMLTWLTTIRAERSQTSSKTNVLKDYQKIIVFETILMAGFILLLFAGLFYSISRRSLAEQKAEYEKRNNVPGFI